MQTFSSEQQDTSQLQGSNETHTVFCVLGPALTMTLLTPADPLLPLPAEGCDEFGTRELKLRLPSVRLSGVNSLVAAGLLEVVSMAIAIAAATFFEVTIIGARLGGGVGVRGSGGGEFGKMIAEGDEGGVVFLSA